jgi:peptidoglycan hydrolase CwlO-like protein
VVAAAYPGCKGEKLSAQEQELYEAGRQQMVAEEKLEGSIEELRQTRQRMLELKAEYNRMHARYEAMEAEIAALEKMS